MSQFGFFNTPQSQPARPGYDDRRDAFLAPHPVYDAPRRYDDPYARAPSPPPRAAYFDSPSAMSVYPSGPMLAQPVYAPDPRYDDRPMVPMAPMSSHYPAAQMQPAPYDMRDPYPSSWRPEPTRDERHEFFGGGDTWRSSRRDLSPPRDRGRDYNTAAFAAPRNYSTEFSRTSFRDDRPSPPRARREDRSERASRPSRHDDKDRREPRRTHDDRDRKRHRSRDRKKEERKEDKTEKTGKSRDRDSREPREKTKENGEKKRRVDDKREEVKEDKEKEEEKIEPEIEETKDEPENKEEDTNEVEIIEDDEFEQLPEEEKEKEEIDRIEEEMEEPKRDEHMETDEVKIKDENWKTDEVKRKDENWKIDEVKRKDENWKTDKTEHERQSRIRSPSLEKKKESPSRSPSIEKKKKDDSGFKVLTDATFDEIHRPGIVPYGNFHKARGIDHRAPPIPDAPRSKGASWAEQWKAKVMITKTAVFGLAGAPPAGASAAPSSVAVAAAYPPAAIAPHPYADPYAARHAPYSDERRPPSRGSAAYPPLAPRAPPEYAYGTPPSAYGMAPMVRREPPIRHPNDLPREDWPPRNERDMYERRRPDERMRSLSPPPLAQAISRRELYDRREEYERRVGAREMLPPGPPREYYEDRYRAELPEDRGRYAADERARFVERVVERARYADVPDDRSMRYAERPDDRVRYPDRPDERSARYADRPPYEKPHARPSDRDRRPSHRERTPDLKPPPIEEIDPSKLVEPLEDDGWDDVARLLSPEKSVVVEKKTKKPLIAAVPPPAPVKKAPLSQHPPPQLQMQPRPRDPFPPSGGFFSQPVPSVRSKIAFHDSQPFFNQTHEDPHRAAYPPAATAPRRAPAPEEYSRALSYEELASSNGAAAYRSGPAPGWERGSRGY